MGLPQKRSIFFPFGVAENTRQFLEERAQDGPLQVAFVGSFYPWHGVRCLIRAFARMSEQVSVPTLVLMGDGLMRAQCEREVQELELGDRVEFTGWLSRDQMIEKLRDVHIGVAPYLEVENFISIQ